MPGYIKPPSDTPLLPPVDDQPFAHIPEYQTAYNDIVAAERHAVELYNFDQSDESLRDRVMCVRVVGLFLVEFYKKRFVLFEMPCFGIVHQVAMASQGEDGEERIVELGESYRDYLIRGFMIECRDQYERYRMIFPFNGRNPEEGGFEIEGHDDEFETIEDMGRHWLEAVGNDYRTVRRKVLVRDDYRCVVTGVLDNFHGLRWLCSELSRPPLEARVPSYGGHIIPEYMIDPISKKGFSSARFLEILEELHLQDLVTDLTKSKGGVHNPRNMLTMRIEPLYLFQHLDLWFEPTSDPCEYTTHVFVATDKEFFPGFRDRVHLESKHGVPAPDRKLLTFHGVCSRVGYQSAAACWEPEESDDEIDEV